MINTYSIEKITDFLKVPVERRGECLIEFNHWLNVSIMMREMFGDSVICPTVFNWKDDGLKQCEITIDFQNQQCRQNHYD